MSIVDRYRRRLAKTMELRRPPRAGARFPRRAGQHRDGRHQSAARAHRRRNMGGAGAVGHARCRALAGRARASARVGRARLYRLLLVQRQRAAPPGRPSPRAARSSTRPSRGCITGWADTARSTVGQVALASRGRGGGRHPYLPLHLHAGNHRAKYHRDAWRTAWISRCSPTSSPNRPGKPAWKRAWNPSSTCWKNAACAKRPRRILPARIRKEA